MNDWASDAVFYHLYPLGCLGAEERNQFDGSRVDRLSRLQEWIGYLADLGVNAVCLGPVFESSAHGYDTADYYRVDRRLGDNDSLAVLSRSLHDRGIRLVLDGVFHHTGRDFWAFRNLQEKGESSVHRDWYHLDFTRRSSMGDPFYYEGWAGHYDLVKLNVRNEAVRDYLLKAVSAWIEWFQIDGLRIDAADSLDLDFQRELAAHCRSLRPDFWLMGEVVHGDYRHWAYPDGLSSITNYEVYKGLWSSHNDRNYYEIAYSLNRQFGPDGIYRGLDLYTFADNHDVDRVASTLKDAGHLYPLYVLLLTMPGVPSLYYGSECGIEGRKAAGTDAPLRPALDPVEIFRKGAHPDLHQVVKQLIALRHQYVALRRGDYAQLHVAHEQFGFLRRLASSPDEAGSVVVVVNAANRGAEVALSLPFNTGRLIDRLNRDEVFQVVNGRCVLPLHSHWARVLIIEEVG